MRTNDDNAGDDGLPPSWLTPDERVIWLLEGFDKLAPTVSVPFAAKFIGLGRSTAYCCVRDGTIGSARFGRRIVIPRYELFRALFKFRPPRPEAA
jgi:excisionase family DNA binding protein